jgi:hypothetical protein
MSLVRYQKAQLSQNNGVPPRYVLDLNKLRLFISILSNVVQIMHRRIIDVTQQARMQSGAQTSCRSRTTRSRPRSSSARCHSHVQLLPQG